MSVAIMKSRRTWALVKRGKVISMVERKSMLKKFTWTRRWRRLSNVPQFTCKSEGEKDRGKRGEGRGKKR